MLHDRELKNAFDAMQISISQLSGTTPSGTSVFGGRLLPAGISDFGNAVKDARDAVMPVERNLPSLATLADPAPGGPDSFSELKICDLNPLAEWERLPPSKHSELALPESFAELQSIAINRLGGDLPTTSGWTAGDGRPCTFAELAIAGMSDLVPSDDSGGRPQSVPATLQEMWLMAEPFRRSSPEQGSSPSQSTPVSPVPSAADGSRTFVEGLELTVLPEEPGLAATVPTVAAVTAA
eukprot:CAMPEP_0204345030 /NCGR_PEP_ID=MMETSP0469-20131031/26083_1 /ASSEMBLY_ACC=CAM_ASM_000384 /TAXON_ID=2969 /ORGANISM="Oxyrrhis marina" /LENGTH=237 /DNA_ID=CAMNT_0051330401 /DNA_START=1 /DNA_END=710 /DNA_ORIENTATION=+